MRVLMLIFESWLMAMSCCFAASGALSPAAGAMATCSSAIDAAEHIIGIPHDLLAAIGRVETGRRDPRTGAWAAWPWSVDIDGQGAFYDTREQAIAAVRAAQARGGRSIDVGCLQVNLLHHPNAFPNLEDAFDPAANAMFAARFLSQLFAQAGSWPKAAAMYHSATPNLGIPYEERVLATWHNPTTAMDGNWTQAALEQASSAMIARPMVTTAQAVGFLPPRRSVGGILIGGNASPISRTVSGAVAGHSLGYYRSAPVLAAVHVPGRIGP